MKMKVIQTIKELRTELKQFREEGKLIGFVPTMGALHPGHASLVKRAVEENDVVLIHDDLLATGGTMLAAYHLVQKLNPKKVYINFIIELEGLKGRSIFPTDAEIDCLLTLEGK